MDYSEKWGKDVDEAVRLALADLSLTEEEVVVTVLEEPTKGFFGLGASLAKVRVEKATGTNSAKVEEAPTETPKEEVSQENRTSENIHKARDLRKKDGGKPARAKSDGGSGNRSDKQDRPNRSDRSDRPSRSAGNDREFDNKQLKDTQISEKPADLVADSDSEAAKFFKQITDDMELDIEIEAFKNAECLYLEVTGKDSRTVIGKRGQTLDAIQYLTNLVVNKDKEDYLRVVIDVEGYRSRREKTLESLADKLARKAQKTGRNVRLEPMNPYERKVIHATLQGYEGITTRSEGEEPYRRVIIEKK